MLMAGVGEGVGGGHVLAFGVAAQGLLERLTKTLLLRCASLPYFYVLSGSARLAPGTLRYFVSRF